MSARDPRVTLRQLVDFIDEAQTLVASRILAQVASSDRVLRRVFERVMELVSECAKRMPLELRENYPAVPWRQVTGMRDVISHAYEGDLAHEILWSALDKDFPALKAEVQRMLADLG